MLPKLRPLRLPVLVLALALACSGCEQVSRELITLLHPASQQDVLKSVRRKIADGNYKEARDEGERFLAREGDPSGGVAWEAAKACVQLGDNEQGMRLVEQAVRARAVTGLDLMSEPMLSPLRADPRLQVLAAGLGASQPFGAGAAPQAQVPANAP